MLSKLPLEITEYLVDKLPPYTGVLIIKCDSEGKIIDFHGPHKEYLAAEPKKGEAVHNFVPALFSMVPPLISPMVLHKVKAGTEIHADIHLVNTSENENWIFFVDQELETKGIKELLQRINENKLSEEYGSAKYDSADLLSVFDYINLKIVSDESAIIENPVPQWFELLKPDFEEKNLNYTEVFPYLEVFLFEAKEFWDKKTEGKIKSGVWTQNLPNGEEIVLTAFAIYNQGKEYILIRPFDQGFEKEQFALQMARDQKLAYEKLEKAEQKLKTLLDYKDKFVSIISHDLRSPVAAVLGIAEMLANDKEELAKLDDFYKEMILSIKEEMLRLLDYNDKLYHWSNLELGNFKITKEEVSLKKVIETAHRTSEKKLSAKNITFSTNLHNDININVDLTLFLQVLNNLMANAIKFTPESGSVSIDVEEGKTLRIIVKDSGVGMPKEVCNNIFSGFTRASTSGTGGEKGTGLGLGIVKKIIDEHGFNIHVESEVGKGSSFIINL